VVVRSEYETVDEAHNAVQMLNDAELDGRALEVRIDHGGAPALRPGRSVCELRGR
jgi:hypothetical protein